MEASLRKRNKRKYLLIAAGVTVVLLLILLVSWSGVVELGVINRNSSIPVSLGEGWDPGVIGALQLVPTEEGQVGGTGYENADRCIKIALSSYPDALIGSQRVTAVMLTEGNTEDHILGVLLGDRTNVAYEKLGNCGFDTVKTKLGIRAWRGNIVIDLAVNEKNRISSICAYLEGSNIFGIQFQEVNEENEQSGT